MPSVNQTASPPIQKPAASRPIKQLPPSRNGATRTSTTKSVSVVDRIAPISFDSDDGINIILYGKSGTGKTTLWSTFPGPILAIICSGGRTTGELRSLNTPELRKKVDQVVLHESSEVWDLIEHVRATGKYKTVVLDHVSGLQDLTLKELLGIEEIPTQKYFGFTTRDNYGTSGRQCTEFLRGLLNLPTNTVIIGQERVFGGGDEGDETTVPSIGPAVTPGVAGWLNPAVDYVLQTFKRQKYVEKDFTANGKTTKRKVKTGGIEYCVRCEPHDVITTKFRVPKGHQIPDAIADPSYEKIMAVLAGAR